MGQNFFPLDALPITHHRFPLLTLLFRRRGQNDRNSNKALAFRRQVHHHVGARKFGRLTERQPF